MARKWGIEQLYILPALFFSVPIGLKIPRIDKRLKPKDKFLYGFSVIFMAFVNKSLKGAGPEVFQLCARDSARITTDPHLVKDNCHVDPLNFLYRLAVAR
ncbi:hypothetical protein [Shewanella spartinae]|uniref:hypothetical protein n=1 Tax=Shewanella spartinae TaxID=2864205 RepID=UPI001C65F4D7|nr:hypothetical protein [Shewanella spartinae]QYJ93566.1 hypothetical protein K0I31_18620 [Shewanella spartinae]